MEKIKIVRDELDINKIILDTSYDKKIDPEELEKKLKKTLEKFKQFAFCVESGVIIAVIDQNNNLELNIPGYLNT